MEAHIIGAGLIGTSIALKLKELGWSVSIEDQNAPVQKLAQDLIGNFETAGEKPDFIIAATPPDSVIEVLKKKAVSYSESIFIDVSSVKANLLLEIEKISELSRRFVGTHPISGREVNGPQSARSDLFLSRAWILTPSPQVDEERVSEVAKLITLLGASPYRMDPKEHDLLFAGVSHLPQLVSVALAASLSGHGDNVNISGQGLRDMLRIAGSDGSLWSSIFAENREDVLMAIDAFSEQLVRLRAALQRSDLKEIEKIFASANQVHGKLSGKHGSKPRAYEYLMVVIEDKPGQLGLLFKECGEAGVNIEDVSIEHSPNQESGLIRIALNKGTSQVLRDFLVTRGWRVHW